MSENISYTTTPAAPAESAGEGTDGQGVTSGANPVDRAAYDALKAEFDAFKLATVEVATKYAERHNMCGAIDSALKEIGLRRVKSGWRVTATLSMSWDMSGKTGPTETSVWKRVEEAAERLRYDGAEYVVADMCSRPEDFSVPGLVISADYTVTQVDPGPDAHLITPVRGEDLTD